MYTYHISFYHTTYTNNDTSTYLLCLLCHSQDKDNANARALADSIIATSTINTTNNTNTQKDQTVTKGDKKVEVELLAEDAEGGEVHMDAMAFGMGCCCLQVTMQARSDRESRFLHDQVSGL